MKFHLPSYVLGLVSGLAVSGARERVRPVIVELASVATAFSKVGWAVVERQREWFEDLWAEVDERVRQRFKTDRTTNGRPTEGAGAAVRS